MTNTKKKRKTALYIRVSTDAQMEEGYSVEAQIQMLEGYCASREIKDFDLYIDGGYTGANIERPEMKRLISDIQNGIIENVVVYKLDRLSRSQKDTLYLIEDVLIPNDTGFVSLRENMDTSTPIGRAMLGIMSAFAQLERETIKERTSIGKKERVKNGLWPGGGKIPFGYDYDKTKGILVPNDDAQTVRQVYSLYLQGYSTLKIAKLTGLKYERLAIQILKRKTNIGYIVYNGTEYKGCHEPLVSEEVFYAVQEELKRRARKNTRTSKALLSGLVVCGVCGAKMRYQKWSDGKYKIYCYSRDSSKTHLHKGAKCDNVRISAEELEKTVINDVFSLKYEEKTAQEDSTDVLEVLEKTRTSLRRRLSRLYELYSNAEDDVLLEEINRLKEELSKIDGEILTEKESRTISLKSRQQLEKLNALQSVWDVMTLEEKQSVLRELIEKIVITNDSVEIFYTENIK